MSMFSGMTPGIKQGFAVAIGVLVAIFVFAMVSRAIK